MSRRFKRVKRHTRPRLFIRRSDGTPRILYPDGTAEVFNPFLVSLMGGGNWSFIDEVPPEIWEKHASLYWEFVCNL